jgi:hypothetical protein
MSWTYRRKTRLWQQYLDWLLNVALVLLALVLLVEVFLLLK